MAFQFQFCDRSGGTRESLWSKASSLLERKWKRVCSRLLIQAPKRVLCPRTRDPFQRTRFRADTA